MDFKAKKVEYYIPDGKPLIEGLTRTTYLAIGAHQDDLEMMAVQPILECYEDGHKWFAGVNVTDGRGSPRTGKYAHFDDDEMVAVRTKEQFKAARIGKYAAQIVLGYSSAAVKDGSVEDPVSDLTEIIRVANPRYVYTHNLADKHDTHVAVALRVIDAIRALPAAERPEKLYGCEVWRGLDWLLDEDKVLMDVSEHDELQMALLEVFESQISGGKRYDLASMGRRRANATFFASHLTDATSGLSFAMDMSVLIRDESINPASFVRGLVERFAHDAARRLETLF